MPLKDTSITAEFQGLELDVEALRRDGTWHEQGTSSRMYGFPRSRNLWVREIEPFLRCPHASVRLFVLLRLGRGGRIKAIETAVHQCYADGTFDELLVPFFPPDRRTTREALADALTPTARAQLAWRSGDSANLVASCALPSFPCGRDRGEA